MGTKRKIPIEKRETGTQISVTCSKRRVGLYSKAADLCVLAGARIAVLLNPPSSDATFYSFGHPSADAVVDAFLENRVPEATDEDTEISVSSAYRSTKEMKTKRQRQDVERMERNRESQKRKLGFWWEEIEDFEHCKLDELRRVIDRLQKLRDNVVARLNTGISSNRHENNVEKSNVFTGLGTCSSHLSSEISLNRHDNNVDKSNVSTDVGSDPQSVCDKDTVNLTEPVPDLGHPDEIFRAEDFGISLEDLGFYQFDSIFEFPSSDPWQGLSEYTGDFLGSTATDSLHLWDQRLLTGQDMSLGIDP